MTAVRRPRPQDRPGRDEAPDPPPSRLGRLLRTSALPVVIFVVIFVVAAIRLAARRWVPVLDLAMTELRVRDVGGRYTPLIGQPGRFGTTLDQGSHPGPLTLYLYAPVYRLLGASAGAFIVSSCALGAAACAGSVLIARRLGGWLAQWAVVAVLLVVITILGLEVVTQPWNPYTPLLFWVLAMVAAWTVLAGEHRNLVVVAAAASVGAQAHVSFLLQAGALGALAGAPVVFAAVRGRDPVRPRARRALAWTAGVTAVLWSPVVLDQLTRTPGNIGILRDDFAASVDPTIGFRAGGALLARHLDLFAAVRTLGHRDGSPGVHALGGPIWPGLLLVAAWLVTVGMAVRTRHRRLLALDAVLAVVGLAGWLTMARISGTRWFYLTLWAYVLGPLLALSILWTLWIALAPRLGRVRADRVLRIAVGSLVVTLTVLLVGRAAVVDVPDPRLSRSVRAVLTPTVRALDAGRGTATGRNGRYAVLWADAAYFGSSAYGLLNELERQGIDVGVPRPYRVPATRHRVLEPSDADAVVLVATGSFIEDWEQRPGATEVAAFDPRTAGERREFGRRRSEVRRRLRQVGRADLTTLVDTNLAALIIDPTSPPFAQQAASRLLELGEPIAVFLVDPATLS